MKKLSLIVLFYFLHNCGLNKNDNTNKTDTIVNLKKFSYEPQYRLKVISGLSYEIRINDIPIAIRNNSGSQTIWYPINNTITKSGLQTMEVKTFPKLTKDGLGFESFIGEDKIEVVIEQTAWDTTGSLEEPKEVAKYTLPIKDYTKISTQKDILKFNATVPYKLLNWNDGQVFKAEDSLMLKTKVVKFYTELKYLYENQQGKDYIDITEKGLFNLYQSSYFDKVEAEDYISHKKKFISDKKRKLEPLV